MSKPSNMNEHFTPTASAVTELYPYWPEINVKQEKRQMQLPGHRQRASHTFDQVTLRTTIRVLWNSQWYVLRCTDCKEYAPGMTFALHLMDFIQDVYRTQVSMGCIGPSLKGMLDPNQEDEVIRLFGKEVPDGQK